MNKIELLKKLIAQTPVENEKELADLNDELIKAIGEQAEAKVREEIAAKKVEEDKKAADVETQKTVDEARKNAPMAKIPGDVPGIVTGTPSLYKGFQLKKAIDDLQHDGRVNSSVRKSAIANPERAELAAMFMINKLAYAYDNKKTPEQVAKAMNEGTPTAGGFLTPVEQNMAVFSYIRDVSIILTDAQHIAMKSDVMELPAENAKVSMAWTDEATDATETTPSIAQVKLTATRLDGYTKSSNELLDDDGSPGGIVGMLTSQFIEESALSIDEAGFKGTGSPVSGIFTAAAGYTEEFDAGSTNFSELLESNLRAVIAKIRPNRRGNAKWYMSTSVLWNFVRGLKDSNGDPLFYETMNGAAPAQMLLGKPVREGNDDVMPSATAVSTGMMVFGDLAGFVVGDRLANTKLFVDPYSLSRSNQTQFLMFQRWAFAHAMNLYYARIATPSA